MSGEKMGKTAVTAVIKTPTKNCFSIDKETLNAPNVRPAIIEPSA